MLGTLINVLAILAGALLALTTRVEISVRRQQLIKVLLGVATVVFGFKLLGTGLRTGGTAGLFFGQFGIVVLAMVIGHALGRLCRIQEGMNQLGQSAKEKLEKLAANGGKPAGEGFIAATILFCAAPLGIIGALEDGLSGYIAPLVIKGVMDGLAAFSFARLFGFVAGLAAVPLAALLSAFAWLGTQLAPWLEAHGVIGVVHASAGLLMTYVALVIFEVKKVNLGDYLPSLLVAPALMKLAKAL
jgi:uncharacterized protein